MTRETPNDFQAEVQCLWHGADEAMAQPASAVMHAQWSAPGKMRWYKVAGYDPVGTKNPQTYMQMAAAQSVEDLAKVLSDGQLTYPIDWKIAEIYEWSAPAFDKKPSPEARYYWKKVDFRSVSGFAEEVMATGGNKRPQISVQATTFVSDQQVSKVVKESLRGALHKDVPMASAIAKAFGTAMLVEQGRVSSVIKVSVPPPVTTLCGCQNVSSVIYLQHQLVQLNVFGDFLRRNGITLLDSIPLSYHKDNRSWLHQSHFRGSGSEGEEDWRLVVEWKCASTVAHRRSQNESWQFTLLCSRFCKSGTRQTSIRANVPESAGCVEGSLSAKIKVDFATLQVSDVNESPFTGIVEDGIKMLSGSSTDSGNYLFLWIADRQRASEYSEFSLLPYLPESHS